jgi:hypothetical protein
VARRRALRRRAIVGALCAVGSSATSPARAEELGTSESDGIAYEAPSGCPERSGFDSEVAKRVGADRAPHGGRVTISRSPTEGYDGRLLLDGYDRDLHAGTCDEVVQALALAVAIAAEERAALAASTATKRCRSRGRSGVGSDERRRDRARARSRDLRRDRGRRAIASDRRERGTDRHPLEVERNDAVRALGAGGGGLSDRPPLRKRRSRPVRARGCPGRPRPTTPIRSADASGKRAT